MRELVGQRLGQYDLLEVVGRGGMATVYKAYQPTLDRVVAVKVLTHALDDSFTARFQREATSIAQLQHRNILAVHDSGEHDGVPYLVTQYVEGGRTLSDEARTAMDPVRAVGLMQHVLAALGYAHQRGIIHRDVKPGNVLLSDDDWPLLSDFGIAKLLQEDAVKLTVEGALVGTAAYMAPEQATGGEVDARTDLYAAGVVLYQLVTGRVPFQADTPPAMMVQHAYEAPPRPRQINPDLPSEVEAVLLRALAKNPDWRYQSAEEMAQVLGALGARLSGQRPVVAAAPTTPISGPVTAPGTPPPTSPSMPPPASYPGASSWPSGPQTPVGPPPLPPALPARQEPGAAPAPRTRGGRRRGLIGAGILSMLAVLGVLAVFLRVGAAEAAPEVLLEPAAEPGANPFTGDVGLFPTPLPRPAPPPSPGPSAVQGQATTVSGPRGSTPGLYGGTLDQSSCDREQLIAFLQSSPEKASAWVQALNSDSALRWSGGSTVQTGQIGDYINELTPVLLRSDTRVTNHGFLDGQPTPHQSVLQAGTAVLVDTHGVPRARCACGNPLIAPLALDTEPRYVGEPWAGFDSKALVAVQPSTLQLDELVLVDVATGERFSRPVGTDGTADRAFAAEASNPVEPPAPPVEVESVAPPPPPPPPPVVEEPAPEPAPPPVVDEPTEEQSQPRPRRPRQAPPSEAPPSEAPPSEAPPSEAPPSEAPPSEAPPSEAPPSEAPPCDGSSCDPPCDGSSCDGGQGPGHLGEQLPPRQDKIEPPPAGDPPPVVD